MKARREPAAFEIVTAIFGDYEPLRALPDGTRGKCFTDGTNEADGWKLRGFDRPHLSRRLLNRYVKARIHKFTDARVTLYIDGQYKVTGDPREWALEALGDGDFAAYRHPLRTCVYAEAEACIEKRRGDPERIAAQVARYRAAGLPENAGLFGGGILIRRNTAANRAIGDAWWSEIESGSERDQLSLGFLVWKLGVQVRAIPGCLYRPPFGKFVGHPRRKRS